MSDFYLDANGTDGSDLSKVDRVYPSGKRVPLSEPEPPPAPDWVSFRLGFLNDSGYKRVRELVDLKLVIDLQDVVGSDYPNLSAIQKCWNALIDALFLNLLNKPKSAEIVMWKKLAEDTKMAFTFDSSTGKITL